VRKVDRIYRLLSGSRENLTLILADAGSGWHCGGFAVLHLSLRPDVDQNDGDESRERNSLELILTTLIAR